MLNIILTVNMRYVYRNMSSERTDQVANLKMKQIYI